jgi:peptide/nickel transport system permease protein
MTATTSVTGAPDTPPAAGPPRRRGNIFTKIAAPFTQSHGIQRFMLVSGTLVSVAFILMAFFAPLIAPFSFDTYQDAQGRFPVQGEPTDRNPWGTTVQGFDVMSRAIYGAWG